MVSGPLCCCCILHCFTFLFVLLMASLRGQHLESHSLAYMAPALPSENSKKKKKNLAFTAFAKVTNKSCCLQFLIPLFRSNLDCVLN